MKFFNKIQCKLFGHKYETTTHTIGVDKMRLNRKAGSHKRKTVGKWVEVHKYCTRCGCAHIYQKYKSKC